ncbi:hypothetical protein JD276_07935 [Leucobacter sp. CSA1]|uniref:Uncharacterized protein n=1 Tax=Leucobacter chromiisoli TaxID=2796471 RepID=A0A934Q7M5_9MICO|nr:hypothetical protein [Leucobacter chromiisoli]MBK0418963.1 hypothetical protein [Leucobacter chromiisoli]
MRRLTRATVAVVLGAIALTASGPAPALGLPGPPDARVEPRSDPGDAAGETSSAETTSDETGSGETGSGETSSDGAADLQVLLMPYWLGHGSPVNALVAVRNNGTTVSTGHTLQFAPQLGSDRTVTVRTEGCTEDGRGFRCVSGALRPGEMRQYHFVFSVPSAEGELWPPFWIASVAGAEPDLDSDNDRAVLELPDSTHVQIESDITTRVEDVDGDGRATPGERMEVYVYFANDSAYELQDVQVEISGTVNDHRRLPETIAPGEETTVRFDATVPDLGPEATSGASAHVMARAVGGSVSTSTGTLMLLGPYASPNPEGPLGPQPEPTKHDPLSGTVVDLEAELAARQWVEEWRRLEERRASQVEGDLGEPATETDAGTDAAGSEVEEPGLTTAAIPDPGRPRKATDAAPADPGVAGVGAGQLATAGIGALRGPIIAASALVGLGVILAQIGISRQISAARPRRFG